MIGLAYWPIGATYLPVLTHAPRMESAGKEADSRTEFNTDSLVIQQI